MTLAVTFPYYFRSHFYLYLTVIQNVSWNSFLNITNDQDCVDTGDIRLSVLVNTGQGRGIASVRAEDMVCRSDDNDDNDDDYDNDDDDD